MLSLHHGSVNVRLIICVQIKWSVLSFASKSNGSCACFVWHRGFVNVCLLIKAAYLFSLLALITMAFKKGFLLDHHNDPQKRSLTIASCAPKRSCQTLTLEDLLQKFPKDKHDDLAMEYATEELDPDDEEVVKELEEVDEEAQAWDLHQEMEKCAHRCDEKTNPRQAVINVMMRSPGFKAWLEKKVARGEKAAPGLKEWFEDWDRRLEEDWEKVD